MILLNPFVLFGLLPLYLIYKKSAPHNKGKKILFLAVLFMFFAMTRPALLQTPSQQSIQTHEYIIALDASFSMQATDLKPNRYNVAKKAIKRLIKQHPRDRFTLFVFTSNALLISPPTNDTELSILALDALNPHYILTKGTHLETLIRKVAQLPVKEKNLLIFSDGGTQNNLQKLTQLIQTNHIHPYFIATATQEGAPLKQGKHYLKNTHNALVISKINPLLEQLALTCKGSYYQLTTPDEIDSLSKELFNTQTYNHKKKLSSNPKELFFIPLFIALLLFLVSVTKLQIFFPFALLLITLTPNKAKASILDFYYKKAAKTNYLHKHYLQASHDFQKLTPSPQSYYNIATSYYKAKKYSQALYYYKHIKTSNKQLKQKILYNMANCTVALQHYSQARKLYRETLALGFDNDALYNLHLLQKYHLKERKNLQDLLPSQPQKKQKNREKSTHKQTKKATGNSNIPTKAPNTAQGAGKKTIQKEQTIQQPSKKQKQHNYRFSYKAYELINKGYTSEKEPW